METPVDPRIASLFGSQVRAATLGALANARRPLTAYRVAKMTGAQVIKVITELRRLERAGLIDRTRPERGPVGWFLLDGSLREFLRRRVRIVWWSDWDEEVGARVRSPASNPRVRVELSRYRADPGAVPNPREFTRPIRKDRLLAEAGLPVSRRIASR